MRHPYAEVFVAFSDNIVRCYDQDSGQLLGSLRGHKSRVQHLELNAVVSRWWCIPTPA